MLTRRRYEQRYNFTMPGSGARWRISVTSSSSSSLGIDTTVPSTARMLTSGSVVTITSPLTGRLR
jgi:hypothetical protein